MKTKFIRPNTRVQVGRFRGFETDRSVNTSVKKMARKTTGLFEAITILVGVGCECLRKVLRFVLDFVTGEWKESRLGVLITVFFSVLVLCFALGAYRAHEGLSKGNSYIHWIDWWVGFVPVHL